MKKTMEQKWVDLFNEVDPFNQWQVGDNVYCLHCDECFKAEEVRFEIEKGARGIEFMYAVCPYEGCDGTAMDFAHEPWWREGVESASNN